MKPRNLIPLVFLSALILLAMATVVQAQELEEVPASYILEQIENGEDIYLENVRIVGELTLNSIELETAPITRTKYQIEFLGLEEELKIVESKIAITNSVFENDVDFSNTLFGKRLDFNGTAFSGNTDLRGTSFSDDAYFEFASFGGDAYLINASFSDDADFSGASFEGVVSFADASFSGEADFLGASFGGAAFFTDASFNGDAFFRFASFSGKASFADASFSGEASFADTSFNGDASFMDASFSGDVNFHSCDFKSMEVSWSSLKDSLVFDGPTYVKLIKNFGELEQFEDADDAYFQYRLESTVQKEWSLSKLGDVFMLFLCGYGVKPQLAIAWAVIIILLFTLIYWWGSGIKRLKDENEDNRVSLGDALYFSMVTFTTVGYGDWYPTDKYRKFVMIEGLLGWLLLALFLVTLANVMIRP
jgi:hypothetical protein